MRTKMMQQMLIALLLAVAAEAFAVQVAPQEDPLAHPLPPPPPAPFESSQLLGRASATTTVITGKDLQSLGTRFLTDALRIAPGLEVQRVSAVESNVSVRSYNDD